MFFPLEVVYLFLKDPGKRGIFNLGTGNARTWNDLANALFSSLGMKPNIEYFEMPEVLKGKYQNFTEADLGKLKKALPRHKFSDLKDAVKDYVGYLEKDAYL